jgi:hypothetical protein
MSSRRTDLTDVDLTFLVHVYRNASDLPPCLDGIRAVYPDSSLLLISDGDDDPTLLGLANQYGAELVLGERLFPMANGGQIVQRMLDAYLNQPSDYLFKVDADIRVHRRFRYLPTTASVFGTLERSTAIGQVPIDPPNVQGGCMGFTRDAAESLAESGLLQSDELLDPRSTYADCPDMVWRAEDVGLVSIDFLTRWACTRLGIPLQEFPEGRSLYQGAIPANGGGFAITHPHKGRANVGQLIAALPGRARRFVRRRLRELEEGGPTSAPFDTLK